MKKDKSNDEALQYTCCSHGESGATRLYMLCGARFGHKNNVNRCVRGLQRYIYKGVKLFVRGVVILLHGSIYLVGQLQRDALGHSVECIYPLESQSSFY